MSVSGTAPTSKNSLSTSFEEEYMEEHHADREVEEILNEIGIFGDDVLLENPLDSRMIGTAVVMEEEDDWTLGSHHHPLMNHHHHQQVVPISPDHQPKSILHQQQPVQPEQEQPPDLSPPQQSLTHSVCSMSSSTSPSSSPLSFSKQHDRPSSTTLSSYPSTAPVPVANPLLACAVVPSMYHQPSTIRRSTKSKKVPRRKKAADSSSAEREHRERKQSRNREHARTSRLRKKTLTLELHQAVDALKHENQRIQEHLQQRSSLGSKRVPSILRKERKQRASSLFLEQLQTPANRVLNLGAVAILKANSAVVVAIQTTTLSSSRSTASTVSTTTTTSEESDDTSSAPVSADSS